MANPKTKIAIIEDDPAIVQMYRMKFESEGYDVQTAGDGQAGLALVQTFQPAVILLDLMMPMMDGVTMLQRLRAEPWGKDIKVIVLTNVGQGEVQESVKQYDVKDFIIKADMTPKQVADHVKKVL